MKNQSGFTLIEVIVVVALVAILASVALYSFAPMLFSATSKEAARNSLSVMRDARSRAVAENTAYSAVYDLDSKNFWLAVGDPLVKVKGYGHYAKNLSMAIGADCNTVTAGDGDETTGELIVTFNPNGSCVSGAAGVDNANLYVCVLDAGGTRKYRSGVSSTVTSRAAIQRRNAADTAWD